MWRFNLVIACIYILAAISRGLNDTLFMDTISYMEISFLCLTLLFLLNYLLWKRSLRAYENPSPESGHALSTLLFLFVPPLAYMYLEWMLGYAALSVTFQVFISNIIWFYLVFGLFYCLSSNIRLSIRWGATLCFLLGTVNFFVLAFRDRPILPSDLYVISLAADVAKNFTLQISDRIYIAALLLGPVWSLSLLLPKEHVPLLSKTFFRRIGVWTASLLILVLSLFHFDYSKFMNLPINWWNVSHEYETHGLVASFVCYAQASRVDIPAGYRPETAVQLLNDYTPESLTKEPSPNIIIIMNESWADFSNISAVKTTEDYLPFYHSLTENTVKGTMYVSIWGGNTSNTEYEFLTGNSMAFLPFGSVPYQQYITRPTENLTTVLKDKGYSGTAIHPHFSSGYNRNHVYPLLGFDSLYFREDFPSPEIVRWCVSDRSSFKKITDCYEENQGNGPQFIFNVTMQNHGDFGQFTKDKLFTPSIELSNPGVSSDTSDLLEYFSLLKITDTAFEDLIDYFSQVSEDTVIVMFGDHQPGLLEDTNKLLMPDATDDLKQMQKKYQVPFLIWSNFDIEEKEDLEISANYLNSYLLNLLGMELSPYQNFLLQQYQTIPVMNALGYKTDSGNWYHYGEGPEEYEEQLLESQYLQYYNIFKNKKSF